ncbi:microfibril-associated glycoprotein 4-like isoform X1 [Apostichopus japonicus]
MSAVTTIYWFVLLHFLVANGPFNTFATAMMMSTPESCPTNMQWMTCTCEFTCEDPDGLFGCYNNCSGQDACICPSGYLMKGGDCVNPNQCGCYHNTYNVIPDGTKKVNAGCTETCSCNNNVLTCSSYSCSVDATCVHKDDDHHCSCNEAFWGDGVTCAHVRDCQDIYDHVSTDEGVYKMYPLTWPSNPFDVYCQDGWMYFQYRFNGSVDFQRDWIDYKDGFGSLEGEFWLGNEMVHYISKQRTYELRIDLLFSPLDAKIYLQWNSFRIGPESGNYVLEELGDYSGSFEKAYDYLDFHNGQPFTTQDRDNDISGNNCAVRHAGAWWHRNCYASSLNGIYNGGWDTGICLRDRSQAKHECDIKTTQMKLRPLL